MSYADQDNASMSKGDRLVVKHMNITQGDVFTGTGIELRQPSGVREIVWSPDGTRIAVLDVQDNTTSIWNVSDASLLGRANGDGIGFDTISFSPDGQYLLSGRYQHGAPHGDDKRQPTSFGVLDGLTATLLQRVLPPEAIPYPWLPLAGAATDPKGRFVATVLGAQFPAIIALYDPSNWEPIRFLEKPNADEIPGVPKETRHFQPFVYHGHLRISSDGNLLALMGARNPDRPRHTDEHTTEQVVVLYSIKSNAKAGEIVLATGASGTIVRDIAFSPDSQSLVTGLSNSDGRDQIKIWDVETGTLDREYPAVKSRGIIALDWDRKNKYIAVSTEDSKIRLYDAKENELRAEIHVQGWTGALSFSPDGNRIAYSQHDTILIKNIRP